MLNQDIRAIKQTEAWANATPSETLIMLSIMTSVDGGKLFWGGRDQIVADTKLGMSTVKRLLPKLVAKGLLIDRGYDLTYGMRHRYEVATEGEYQIDTITVSERYSDGITMDPLIDKQWPNNSQEGDGAATEIEIWHQMEQRRLARHLIKEKSNDFSFGQEESILTNVNILDVVGKDREELNVAGGGKGPAFGSTASRTRRMATRC